MCVCAIEWNHVAATCWWHLTLCTFFDRYLVGKSLFHSCWWCLVDHVLLSKLNWGCQAKGFNCWLQIELLDSLPQIAKGKDCWYANKSRRFNLIFLNDAAAFLYIRFLTRSMIKEFVFKPSAHEVEVHLQWYLPPPSNWAAIWLWSFFGAPNSSGFAVFDVLLCFIKLCHRLRLQIFCVLSIVSVDFLLI